MHRRKWRVCLPDRVHKRIGNADQPDRNGDEYQSDDVFSRSDLPVIKISATTHINRNHIKKVLSEKVFSQDRITLNIKSGSIKTALL